jgi:hypothetical protein
MLFLKIMLGRGFRNFFIPQFFSLLLDLPLHSRGIPAGPSRQTSMPRQTCRPFATHQCAAANVQILRFTPVCRGKHADPSLHTSVPRQTCRPFASHQCTAANVQILRVTAVCRGKHADPSLHTRVPLQTCRPFTSHQCASTHWCLPYNV